VPETDGFRSGTPGWTDLAAPDVDAATRFYEGLFGWESFSPGPEDQTGGYRIFLKGGMQVAGYGPPGEGEPPSWRTYVIVDDLDSTVDKIEGAGGNVMAQMDVMDQGRMAVFGDPTGAVCCLWQPGQHKGAQLVNETGAMSWNELLTRDTEAAKSFYGAVFGWGADDQDMDGMTYTMWRLGDAPVGGMLDMTDRVPDEVPPNWTTYFNVDDCDATAANALDLGGAEIREPEDMPAGRFAVLSDPNGAAFAVISPRSPGG
jgi:predicted enzyme related to lactoylglutathione lyase